MLVAIGHLAPLPMRSRLLAHLRGDGLGVGTGPSTVPGSRWCARRVGRPMGARGQPRTLLRTGRERVVPGPRRRGQSRHRSAARGRRRVTGLRHRQSHPGTHGRAGRHGRRHPPGATTGRGAVGIAAGPPTHVRSNSVRHRGRPRRRRAQGGYHGRRRRPHRRVHPARRSPDAPGRGHRARAPHRRAHRGAPAAFDPRPLLDRGRVHRPAPLLRPRSAVGLPSRSTGSRLASVVAVGSSRSSCRSATDPTTTRPRSCSTTGPRWWRGRRCSIVGPSVWCSARCSKRCPISPRARSAR